MKLIYSLACMLLASSAYVQAQSRIVCELVPGSGEPITGIWPSPYLSNKGELCFDVKGWTEYSGQNCVKNGGQTSWTGLILLTVDGESLGRDSTSFRVVKPVINNDRIEYTIEWSRNSSWEPMQRVKMNRLTGEAVSYFINMHGGDSYQCHLEKRKL